MMKKNKIDTINKECNQTTNSTGVCFFFQVDN